MTDERRALADELDRLLNKSLETGEQGYKDELRQMLWDNKAGIIAFLRSPQPSTASREAIAQVIYEVEPYYENGEFVDSFLVSPGGNLSWLDAKDRDAEFVGDSRMIPITKFAYRCADAILALAALSAAGEGKTTSTTTTKEP